MTTTTHNPFLNLPILENDQLKLVIAKESDFGDLYKVASDPLMWEQHPNKNRYQKEIFKIFFEGALVSKSAFLVYDKNTNELIGSSRYYDWDETKKEVAIGYTFVARNCWGKGFNPALKKLMMQYAFQFVDKIIFHIGANNIRSQKAIEKIGAKKIGEQQIEYYGEEEKLNFIYSIEKP